MNKTVLVTGIGGNVGQGILRNIKIFRYNVRVIGTNTEYISAGNHLCDDVYVVPFAEQKNYFQIIKKICDKERVDLIIPSTDAETYYLACESDSLPELSSSPMNTALHFYNKLKTWQLFDRLKIKFAETVLPSSYKNSFKEYIVKPIKGRGSRNIYINPKDPTKYSDEYIIQKLYKGKEITTSFYVTKKNQILGSITFERMLSHGFTQQCEVTKKYDKELDVIIKKLTKEIEIKGSCNIQSIVENGTQEIITFEVNGRISGTNSIRSQFGFEDVRYTLDELLFQKKLKKPVIKSGSAIRILVDIIYPNTSIKDIHNHHDDHYLF